MGSHAQRLAAIALAALMTACATPQAAQMSPRPTTPRLAPVDKSNLTPAQAAMLASRADLNIYKTLAHHPALYARWSPLGQVLLNNTNIQPRHREMAMLRIGWLCQAEYEWAQHARIAKASAGLTSADLLAIAEGPGAKSWSAIDRAVLTMADELRYDGAISDATWANLRAAYSDAQIIELMFTASQYQLVSMALNSLGVQDEPTDVEHLPQGFAQPTMAARPGAMRTRPRLPALTSPQTSEAPNLHATLSHNPRVHEAWQGFMDYLSNAEYEFAHHRPLASRAGLTDAEIDRVVAGPDAQGWSDADRVVLRAADELRAQAFITDDTWAALSKTHTPQQIIDLVYTVGGHGMTAVAIRSLGIQTEPGFRGFAG